MPAPSQPVGHVTRLQLVELYAATLAMWTPIFQQSEADHAGTNGQLVALAQLLANLICGTLYGEDVTDMDVKNFKDECNLLQGQATAYKVHQDRLEEHREKVRNRHRLQQLCDNGEYSSIARANAVGPYVMSEMAEEHGHTF